MKSSFLHAMIYCRILLVDFVVEYFQCGSGIFMEVKDPQTSSTTTSHCLQTLQVWALKHCSLCQPCLIVY